MQNATEGNIKEMSKAPAFQLYASDFYMDTNHWTIEEIGIYQRLLLTQWVNGSVPSDEPRLARISGCGLKKFQKWWPTIKIKFHLNGNGELKNLKLEEVRNNQLKYSESRRKNVSTRYKDKPTHEGTHEEDMNLSSSSSSSSSSKDNKKNKDIARSGKPKRAVALCDEDFIKALKENQAYRGIDIERELGKMDAWLMTPRGRGKQRTQQRFLNWLNNAERPMLGFETIPTDKTDRLIYEMKKEQENGHS